jgi:hypothetical protein
MYMPFRMSFEDKRVILKEVAFIDTMVDLAYACESIMTFFIPILNGEGNLIYDHI